MVILVDAFGRQIRDLRLSVTDRCNFKCTYCKTARGVHYVEREALLTYEEIERLARIFVDLGIRKIRVTGGEPLLRKDLHRLIRHLASLSQVEDLALTTNGFNFFEEAPRMKKAGLDRVTLSLDSLQPDRFFAMTRARKFQSVLKSIDAALEHGFHPVKLNCVVVRDFNDDEICDFVRFAQEKGATIRFIEFMPLDEDEGWSRDRVVTGGEILKRLESEFEMEALDPEDPSQTSRNYRVAGSSAQVGLIMPVSRPFCGACSRIRLTADGQIRTCLFSLVEYDIKSLLRSGAKDEALRDFILATVKKKEEGHRIDQPDFVAPSRSMSYIGG